MAIFNANLISGTAPRGVFRAFCEEKDDLEAPACEAWAAGSLVVCLNTSGDKKLSKHVKLPDGTWHEVDGEQAADEQAEAE